MTTLAVAAPSTPPTGGGSAPPEAAAPTTPKRPAGDGAVVVRGGGRTRSDEAKEWKDLAAGDVLANGAMVEASSAEPLEMLLPDGVAVTLEAGGSGRWSKPGKLPSEVNKFVRGYWFVLLEGELDVRMPAAPKGSHAFLVSTRAGTLTDWRGTLHIYSHEETTAAAIFEGALVTGANGKGFPVYDGAGIVMRKGADPDKSGSIPDPPKWGASPAGMESFVAVPAAARAQLGFAWAPVPGVASYRVAIATDPAMTHVVQRATTAQTSFGIVQTPESEGAGDAPLWAEVRAVGTEGIVGGWSSPRPLRVLRYQLPAGAVVARDGAIVLPPGSSLATTQSEGVEAAYENVQSPASRLHGVPLYWTKLAGPIHLSDESPTRIVHLRDPAIGRETESELVLARRQLHADVELSPRNAHPGDPIDARVVVSDPSGRVDPMSEPVTLQALFDLDPTPVAWQRAGNVWTGHLGARRTAWPSVLRVVVKDGLGAEIGRGFLEIAGQGASSR
jgi:hypothetical protein